MKAFITKYALTSGIKEVDDAEISENCISMISVKSLGCFANFHGEGLDWHLTKEAAIFRANEMRNSKIKSLKKAISKIEQLNFK